LVSLPARRNAPTTSRVAALARESSVRRISLPLAFETERSDQVVDVRPREIEATCGFGDVPCRLCERPLQQLALEHPGRLLERERRVVRAARIGGGGRETGAGVPAPRPPRGRAERGPRR